MLSPALVADRARLARELRTDRPAGRCFGALPAAAVGGQKQRVNIARALCVTPRLLVADEIVSGLDVSVQAQILNLLLDVRAPRHRAVVHLARLWRWYAACAKRVVVMHRGQVVEEGRTEEVFSSPRHPYTRALIASVPPEDACKPWPPPEGELAA